MEYTCTSSLEMWHMSDGVFIGGLCVVREFIFIVQCCFLINEKFLSYTVFSHFFDHWHDSRCFWEIISSSIPVENDIVEQQITWILDEVTKYSTPKLEALLESLNCSASTGKRRFSIFSEKYMTFYQLVFSWVILCWYETERCDLWLNSTCSANRVTQLTVVRIATR